MAAEDVMGNKVDWVIFIGAWVPFSSQLPRVVFQGVSLTRAFQVLTGSLFYLSLRSNAGVHLELELSPIHSFDKL
jgi:hypothetical protein